MNQKTKVFICDCHAPEHQFIVDRDDDEPEVYVNIRLNSLVMCFIVCGEPLSMC